MGLQGRNDFHLQLPMRSRNASHGPSGWISPRLNGGIPPRAALPYSDKGCCVSELTPSAQCKQGRGPGPGLVGAVVEVVEGGATVGPTVTDGVSLLVAANSRGI